VPGFVKRMLISLVLEDAILREESAYRFYEEAEKRAEGEEPRRLLKKLCAEELRHRLKLEQLQRSGDVEQLEFSGREEIEMLDENKQTRPRLDAGSTTADVLNIALNKEKQAVSYYRLIASRSSLRSVRDVFLMLAGEETGHVQRVEQMLREL